MTPELLSQRRPVWEAMSDLFLDTEVRWSVPWVAKVCAESPFSVEALERIFWAEVFPEGIGNLLQVAGEWAMLKLDEPRLMRRAEKSSIPWLARRTSGRMVEKEWKACRDLVPWFRSSSQPEALRWALEALARRYFEQPEREGWEVVELTEARKQLARELWPKAHAVFATMWLDDQDPPEGACAAMVERSLTASAR